MHAQGAEFALLQAELAGKSQARVHDRDVVLKGQLFDRAWHQLLPVPCRTIRLGVNRDNLIRAVEQRLEMFSGKFGGASKDDAQ